MKINFFRTFAKYVHCHLKSIVMYIIFSIIFASIFYLNGVTVAVVWYAICLSIFAAIIFISIDFYKFYLKHKQLTELQLNINFSVEGLPYPNNLIEQDYISLINCIYADKMKKLSDADSSKTDMIDYYTMWVHQIKTPISAMRLLLQSDENVQNYELEAELFKIEQYVEMVLSYLRIDSSSTDFVIQKYSLDSIVKQAVRKYAKLFIKKRITLNLENIENTVLTDEKWLVFVIEQILSNAIKYTNKGKISIYMEQNNVIVIEDTGIGIEAEDLPRIFEKGFTGYNGRHDKKSTGIGLYLCKKIMDKLGHGIAVESIVGQGTKVKLNLEKINITFE